MQNINNIEYEQENPFSLETDSDFHATRRNVTISLIREHIKDKEEVKILDVGCGKGNITKFIYTNFPNSIIDAIDISERAIDLAVKGNPNIHFIQADAMTFNGFGSLYDFIILNNIYEHIENPIGMLINLKYLLEDDGVFIVSTPNRYNIKNVLRKLLGLKIAIPKYHITEYSIGQIIDQHEYAGLIVKSVVFPQFRRERSRVIDFLIYKLIQPIGNTYLKLLNSNTRLGSLLFIVSTK